MNFELITYNDLDEIRYLQPEGWPDIIPEIEFYINSNFCNPIKTNVNGRIVGVGASIVFDHTSWMAHIIVDNNFRKRGIGYEIVSQLLENLAKDSVDTCSLIATQLGQPIYLKAGFRAVAEYSFMLREKPWQDKAISKNVISFREEHRSMIYALDKEISGESREKLLTNYLEKSLVYAENDRVFGYFIPDLREGLIFADTEGAGLELMKIKYSKIDKAVLPSDNIVGIDFLKQNGFVETDKKGTRMVFGKDIDWKPQKIYSRIGGNLG
ncbi:MAG: GNAT family N-acetyltransferase [Candidatus Buchananbacteria bacterium]